MGEANDGQGDTGAGDGNGNDGGDSFLGAIQNEELRGNESLKDFKDLDSLAQSFVEMKGAAPVVPENVEGYDFKVPEGIKIDEEVNSAFKVMALDNKLTNEQCQALIEFDYGRMKKANDQAIATRDEAVGKMKEELGDKYDESLKMAQKVLKALGAEDLAGRTDLGNDPSFFRFLTKIGKAISEDKLNTGGDEGSDDDRPTTDDGRPMLKFKDMGD